jgi:hypothetical protein
MEGFVEDEAVYVQHSSGYFRANVGKSDGSSLELKNVKIEEPLSVRNGDLVTFRDQDGATVVGKLRGVRVGMAVVISKGVAIPVNLLTDRVKLLEPQELKVDDVVSDGKQVGILKFIMEEEGRSSNIFLRTVMISVIAVTVLPVTLEINS